MKINPEWVKHNEIYNEGSEGCNPFPKFLEQSIKFVVKTIPAGKVEFNGKMYDEQQIVAAIAKAQATIESEPYMSKLRTSAEAAIKGFESALSYSKALWA